ncbi:hypothetical protein OOZ53_19575, partial [Hoeflea sp. E7-10]|nr:hypothetical protein [Hoeflea poritis]
MELELEHEIAKRLRHAEANAEPIEPFAHEIGEREVLRAYDIQHLNTQHGLSTGRILRGRKIGLTAKTVQQQLGSGLIDQSQNATVAAIQMAEKKVWA